MSVLNTSPRGDTECGISVIFCGVYSPNWGVRSRRNVITQKWIPKMHTTWILFWPRNSSNASWACSTVCLIVRAMIFQIALYTWALVLFMVSIRGKGLTSYMNSRRRLLSAYVNILRKSGVRVGHRRFDCCSSSVWLVRTLTWELIADTSESIPSRLSSARATSMSSTLLRVTRSAIH